MSIGSEEEYLASLCSERTLAMIKPEAVQHAEKIERILVKRGFTILAKRSVRLSPEQVAEFYQSHYGKPYFPHLVAQIASGTIIALCIAKNNAVEEWKTLMGPKKVTEAQAYWPESIRACFGRRLPHGDYYNGVHGSESIQDARRELHFFFPDMIVGPLPSEWQIRDYLQTEIYPLLSKGLYELTNEKPSDPIIWLADWLMMNDPDSPIISGPDGIPDRCIDTDSSAGEADAEDED